MARGFFIAEITVRDKAEYGRYLTAVKGVVDNAGGRIVVGRNSRRRAVEGEWRPELFFVIEFDSYDAAEAFYFSQAYQGPLQHRLASSVSKAMLVEEQPPQS
ncbi:DUF1330 domain-containing protein [Terricaulis sp.]|uniref:DUF1330 domain-containing protein n=1 Tax=Terricaulis sp. TaxID=2768686 RepID=UPI0037846E7B